MTVITFPGMRCHSAPRLCAEVFDSLLGRPFKECEGHKLLFVVLCDFDHNVNRESVGQQWTSGPVFEAR
jgi:hypothetical protein